MLKLIDEMEAQKKIPPEEADTMRKNWIKKNSEYAEGGKAQMLKVLSELAGKGGGDDAVPPAPSPAPAVSAPTSKYEVGKTYTDAQGNKAKWDGSKWIEVP